MITILIILFVLAMINCRQRQWTKNEPKEDNLTLAFFDWIKYTFVYIQNGIYDKIIKNEKSIYPNGTYHSNWYTSSNIMNFIYF